MSPEGLHVLRLALYYGFVTTGAAGLVLAVAGKDSGVSLPVTILVAAIATFAGGAGSWLLTGTTGNPWLIFGLPALACSLGLLPYVGLSSLSADRGH